MVREFVRFLMAFVFLGAASPASFSQPAETYPEHPDSVRKEGVPEGKIEGPVHWESKIFPGTHRDFWIYVPAQYKAEKPACLFVVQDGLGLANNWKLPTVMDNLIHSGEMPLTIGVFVSPGVVPAPNENAQPRFNRSFEYDGMGDRYAKFLIEEILPEVSKKYRISDNPNDRAIGGASSGAVCAFTVAWERPEAFRRVFSSIGTYVGLRGANDYPTLVRKHEPKPLRVFLQDGSKDLDIYAGSWWVANQDMLSALTWSGYEVEHIWGEGGHNHLHTASIVPDGLRWLWKDHGKEISKGSGDKHRVNILIPGEDWQLVSEGHKFTEGPASNSKGEVFFTDIPNNRIHKIGLDGKVSVFVGESRGANGMMFGPDGFLYAGQCDRLVRYDDQGKETVVIEGAPNNDLVILSSGLGYYTDPGSKKVWKFTLDGKREVVDEGIEYANGVIASADQTLLFVADTYGRFVNSYQIQVDGSLKHKQVYGHLERPDDSGHSGADGMTMDSEGRLYVSSSHGVQVLDQLGRVNLVLRKPSSGWLSNVAFGGPNRDELYATCGDKVFKRKLRAKGAFSFEAPINPPRPGL